MTLELAHLGKMFKASIAQWAPEPSMNANGFNGCSCQKYKHVHTHTHGWGRGEAVGFKMMKDSSNSQISGGEIGQKKKKSPLMDRRGRHFPDLCTGLRVAWLQRGAFLIINDVNGFGVAGG